MRLAVNPNRMELTKLRRRLNVAERGHKLLKDKQDGLIQKYVDLVKQNKKMREDIEKDLVYALKNFLMARAVMSSEALEESIMFPKMEVDIDIEYKSIMSVVIPKIEISKQKVSEGGEIPYSFISTSAELDSAIFILNNLLPRLLELAEVEKTVKLLSIEIEKTRRRVNALEYIMIPQLEETIKFISMKLDENERGNITRLMKVKEMANQNTI